jgi:hypothetical protein
VWYIIERKEVRDLIHKPYGKYKTKIKSENVRGEQVKKTKQNKTKNM